MKVLGIIPARLNSTRLPGKVLAKLGDKPVLQHVWERAKQAKRLQNVIITSDSNKIEKLALKLGADFIPSNSVAQSGTQRIIDLMILNEADIVVNIQGDEPFVNSKDIDRLVAVMINSDEVMATIVTDITTYKLYNSNVVKAYVKDGYAVDFSRQNIWKEGTIYQHVGIYAYRRDFLINYYRMPKQPHEMVEKLEQLRAIENGHKIKIIKTKNKYIGIDTKEDLIEARKRIKEETDGTIRK